MLVQCLNKYWKNKLIELMLALIVVLTPNSIPEKKKSNLTQLIAKELPFPICHSHLPAQPLLLQFVTVLQL